MDQINDYVKAGRAEGLSDETIKLNLTSTGWDENMVVAAMTGKPVLTVPMPPPPQSASPVAVVQQLSTRGLEYTIMFLGLGFSAVSLGILLHNYVDKLFTTESIFEGLSSYASAALIVALPIFALLFIRLRRAEKAEPALRKDASRRKSVQSVLVISFLWGIFKIIAYVYSLMNAGVTDSYNSSSHTSAVGNLLHLVITLGIAGGIFAYYWIDEHRAA